MDGLNYDFLNGKPLRIQYYAQPFLQQERQNLELGLYGQDAWKLPKHIQVNMGVRYDYFGVPSEANKQIWNYDPVANGLVQQGGSTVFDFGEFRSEVATRNNPDGSLSFITIAPGIEGFEFVVGLDPQAVEVGLVADDALHVIPGGEHTAADLFLELFIRQA